MGSQRVRQDRETFTFTSLHFCLHAEVTNSYKSSAEETDIEPKPKLCMDDGESDLGVKRAHGWFNMLMSPTAACLCGGGREKGLKEPMAVKEGLYQPFSEAWQYRGERKRQPPHVNFSSANAVSSEETRKMKEHS